MLAARRQVGLTRFVAIADVNLPRARQIAEKYQGEPYQDYRKLLERKDVDAIITATVDHWRAFSRIHSCRPASTCTPKSR